MWHSEPSTIPDILQLAHPAEPQARLSPLVQHSYHSTHWDGLHVPDGLGSFVSYEGAAALMPLRGRDREALRDLFDRSDIAQIEANIESHLNQWGISQNWEDVTRWLL